MACFKCVPESCSHPVCTKQKDLGNEQSTWTDLFCKFGLFSFNCFPVVVLCLWNCAENRTEERQELTWLPRKGVTVGSRWQKPAPLGHCLRRSFEQVVQVLWQSREHWRGRAHLASVPLCLGCGFFPQLLHRDSLKINKFNQICRKQDEGTNFSCVSIHL